jgi:hypothetical protein
MSTTETPAAPVEEAKAVETPAAPEVAAEAAVAVSIFVCSLFAPLSHFGLGDTKGRS